MAIERIDERLEEIRAWVAETSADDLAYALLGAEVSTDVLTRHLRTAEVKVRDLHTRLDELADMWDEVDPHPWGAALGDRSGMSIGGTIRQVMETDAAGA